MYVVPSSHVHTQHFDVQNEGVQLKLINVVFFPFLKWCILRDVCASLFLKLNKRVMYV